MEMAPITLIFVALTALVFLPMGWFIGSRIATLKAARAEMEVQADYQSQQAQLNSDLALSRQRETHIRGELDAAEQARLLAVQQLDGVRVAANKLGVELSAVQATLQAELEKSHDKSRLLEEQAQQVIEHASRQEALQQQVSTLREQLGMSQEQASLSGELKASLAALQGRYEHAQVELQELREQLGQSSEQAAQLVELKDQIRRLEQRQRETEDVIKSQREQLGQSSEQATQLLELKDKCRQLEQLLRESEDVLQGQREQLGQANEQKVQLVELRDKHVAREREVSELRDQLAKTQSTLAETITGRDKDQKAAEEKLQLLQENKEQLKQEFQNLANQIFDSKQQSFTEQSRQGLDALLKPFKDQLESFRNRVDQVHSEAIDGQSSMKSELVKLIELNAQITTEASNLTKALKGDKKLQGTWGEQKVELLLEQAGLRKGVEYQREANFKNEDHENGRPDFVVQLPEGKHIIIDSKVSLVAYTDYVAAETDEQRAASLAAHVQALRNHVQSLAGKRYPELTGMNSPDFVFLFMPVEPAYLLAAEHSPSLFQQAYEQRIAVVTATTLLPVLRVVANLWSIQRQNQSTLQLAQQASSVYNKLRVFVEKMEKLGHQISTVQKTYADSFNTLTGPHGSLTRTVDKFVDLGVKVVKRLPASVVGVNDEPGAEGDALALEEVSE
ncbi:DNA recombination protein RmuC [Pseudomonas aeruginosa]|nr:DNA recombination protein RmuC [Pseudomonas aeruginosa]MBX6174760.1 DNA recombination protein RmuC [Pseudomonas aeruginosa]